MANLRVNHLSKSNKALRETIVKSADDLKLFRENVESANDEKQLEELIAQMKKIKKRI